MLLPNTGSCTIHESESGLLLDQELDLAKGGMFCTAANNRVIVLPETNLLRVDRLWIKMQPKPFKLLTILSMRAGKLVTKDTINEELWDSYYASSDLNERIGFNLQIIRQSLGKSDFGHPKFGLIETIHNRGLRARE